MNDILKMVYDKELTEIEAQIMFEKTADDFHNGIINDISYELNLNQYEWTAVCHGVYFLQLAKWRYSGWSKSCVKCKKELNYEMYGWTVFNDELCHIKCDD